MCQAIEQVGAGTCTHPSNATRGLGCGGGGRRSDGDGSFDVAVGGVHDDVEDVVHYQHLEICGDHTCTSQQRLKVVVVVIIIIVVVVIIVVVIVVIVVSEKEPLGCFLTILNQIFFNLLQRCTCK